MTETRTTYFGLPQYGAGTDGTFTRADSNEAFGNIEARAAYDDGDQGAALPVTLLKPGRYYKQTVTGGYQLHRRNNAGGWDQVGGTVWSSRARFRGATSSDIVLSSDVAGVDGATLKAGGELATPGIIRSSNVVSAGADLSTDLSTPVNTGRLYVRTRATSERGLVLSAHDNAAGSLLSAQESGGSIPTTIDSRGRLRSQVSAALGGAALTDNVPLVISPGAADVTALDLYGKTTGAVPALRVFPTAGDSTAIISALPTSITLGRASWTSAAINLLAPTIALTGAVGVTGAVTVTGAVAATGAVTGASATVTGAVSAEAAKVTSFTSGSTSGLRSQVVIAGGSTSTRDLRQTPVHRIRQVNLDFAVIPTTNAEIFVTSFVPATTCNPILHLMTFWRLHGAGSSGEAVEPNTVIFGYRILSLGGSVLFSSDVVYEITLGAYSLWNIKGRGLVGVDDCPALQLTAGTTYQLQLWGARASDSAISIDLRHVIGTISEGVLVET